MYVYTITNLMFIIKLFMYIDKLVMTAMFIHKYNYIIKLMNNVRNLRIAYIIDI